jgi:NADH-quinone oxidoreductase subunit J
LIGEYDLMLILFYIAGLVTIASTVMVITRTNAIHALLNLIVSLLSVALIFFVSGAPFVAALEVIIYAGAIMVLFVFVVMLLNISQETIREQSQLLVPSAWIVPVILTLILLVELLIVLGGTPHGMGSSSVVKPKAVGISLYTKYALAVELAGILLMAGIVGAYHLGKGRKTVTHRYLSTDRQALKEELDNG